MWRCFGHSRKPTCYLLLAELSCIFPKKDKKKSKPSAKAYNDVFSMQFMRFANFLGFATPLIPRKGVEGLIIQKLLLEIRTPGTFAIGQQQRQDIVKSIYSCILNKYSESRPSASPKITPDERSQITGSARCGRLFQPSYGQAKTRFFYLNIYDDDAFEPNISNNAYIFKFFLVETLCNRFIIFLITKA